MSYEGENIWIIGASSGIGRDLALELARRGANLFISARRKIELEKLSAEISRTNSKVTTHVFPLDISEETNVTKTSQKISDEVPKIDRIIFMAAIYTEPGLVKDVDIETARRIFDVNFTGALTVSKAALNVFEKQESGQLAICASVAGYIGLPRGQIYSASKAALINLCESLNAEAPDHIDIKLINPGFVETPMTDKNDFDMPMIISPEEAATSIAKGLQSSTFEIHFPKKFTFLMKTLSALPFAISKHLTKRMKS